MNVALVCPASLPAVQFGGILFLCVDLAKEISELGHNVTIYTTDLDFASDGTTFNKNLPRQEKIQNTDTDSSAEKTILTFFDVYLWAFLKNTIEKRQKLSKSK